MHLCIVQCAVCSALSRPHSLVVFPHHRQGPFDLVLVPCRVSPAVMTNFHDPKVVQADARAPAHTLSPG
jgi:hypothetical protein